MFFTGSGLMLLKYYIAFAVYWETSFKLGPGSLILDGDGQQKCPVDLSRLRSLAANEYSGCTAPGRPP